MSIDSWTELFPSVFEPELCAALEDLQLANLSISPTEHNEDLGCWLKRDDLGPCSTHKARGLLIQIAIEKGNGARGFSISSSGNAALAAGAWSSRLGLNCVAFLSRKTAAAKVAAVAASGVLTVVTDKPKNFSRYAAKYGGLVDLRPSKHTEGATGYRLLAAELAVAVNPPPTAIFCFCNSGLTIVGIYQGLRRLLAEGRIADMPQLHAVQCTPSIELAQRLSAEQRPEPSPIAGALGAQAPVPIDEVVNALVETGGSTWMVSNEEIVVFEKTLGADDIAIESTAALAGFQRASARVDPGDRPVVVVAGRRWPEPQESNHPPNLHHCDDYADVRKLLDTVGLGRAHE